GHRSGRVIEHPLQVRFTQGELAQLRHRVLLARADAQHLLGALALGDVEAEHIEALHGSAAADVRDVADARRAIAQLVMGRYALEADGLAFQDALDVRPALLEELRAEHLAHVDTGGRLRLEATPLAV